MSAGGGGGGALKRRVGVGVVVKRDFISFQERKRDAIFFFFENENDAMLVLKETPSTFETLARDFRSTAC